ncbi:MAG: DUF1566 domain-containing protein [Desulforhopalus sp.]
MIEHGANKVAIVLAMCCLAPINVQADGDYGRDTQEYFNSASESYSVMKVSRMRRSTRFSVVDTGQSTCHDAELEIECSSEGQPFYGQDAQHSDKEFDFTDNGDGTETDNNTGLIWQQIPSDMRYSWADAQDYCEALELAGNDHWRTPSLKELFSISDFETGWPKP